MIIFLNLLFITWIIMKTFVYKDIILVNITVFSVIKHLQGLNTPRFAIYMSQRFTRKQLVSLYKAHIVWTSYTITYLLWSKLRYAFNIKKWKKCILWCTRLHTNECNTGGATDRLLYNEHQNVEDCIVAT